MIRTITMGKFISKPGILIIAAIAFGLKALLAESTVPREMHVTVEALKTILLWLFFGALLHIATIIVFSFLNRNKRKNWWDGEPGEKILDDLAYWYGRALVVSLPLALFGGIIYMAVFRSWGSILMISVWVGVMWGVQYYKKRKGNGVTRT